MVDENCTIAGFTLYGNQRKTRLLLPAYLANTLELQDEIAAQKVLTEKKALVSSKAAEVAISIGRLAPHRNMSLLKSIDFNIEGIRTDSDNDLSDATTLTTGFLAKVAAPQNCLRQPLSNDLLLAITLDLAYIQAGGNIIDVLDYLRDPLWDSSGQLVLLRILVNVTAHSGRS
ncbi:hypothetical protein QN360_20605 [Glaciimonas sp. CA11.2]|uniref:hypothetical protein n=1 Tax=Glaciimonas sp. CA11.2 TaxID=3048601 RepID=UPI002AB56D4C|nr:hypothetical protein [Glaciimonas sp. CA11.2]MDY7545064.1 hypothetical protein [Glaciimonas sp. CA11.2]MEB0165305.1 hypothetical protein [Glaciimonas sp. CA11.2]